MPGKFQSTPFSRRETIGTFFRNGFRRISIHSLLTKGDACADITLARMRDFNPLPSHEGRPVVECDNTYKALFQSTPFSRRETQDFRRGRGTRRISIHSLLTKGDGTEPEAHSLRWYFNPLPSHEGRHISSDSSSLLR